MSKMFRDKKEYYSLRKFKGIGLASALVGLAFLSPSVLAEERAPSSAPAGEVGVVAPTLESIAPVTSETVNVVNAPLVVENPTTSSSSKQEEVAKPKEVAKSEEVVKPSVSESPDIYSSLKVEESSLDVKPVVDEGTTTEPNKQASVESSQPIRSRRGKRDVSGQTSDDTVSILTQKYRKDKAISVNLSNLTEVNKVDYSNSSNPSPVSENTANIYNDQIKSIEEIPTSNTNSVRVRVTLKDGKTIPDGGKLVLGVVGLGRPQAENLLRGSDVIGTVVQAEDNGSNPSYIRNKLKNTTKVDEYIDSFESMVSKNLAISSYILTMNNKFSNLNLNRVIEFELEKPTTDLLDNSLVRREDAVAEDNVVFDSHGVKHKLRKELKTYLFNPYDSKAISLGNVTGYVSFGTLPKPSPVNNKLYISPGVSTIGNPNYLDSVAAPSFSFLSVLNRDLNSDSVVARKGDTIKFTLSDNSLFATSSYSVGDIISFNSNDNKLREATISGNRFTDTDKYVIRKDPEFSYTADAKVNYRFKLIEKTDKSYTWELLDDISMKNSVLSQEIKSLSPTVLRSDWVSRFGEENLKQYLSGTERYASKFLTSISQNKGQLSATVTSNIMGVSKELTQDGFMIKNNNLVFGENTTGTVKVVHKTDTGVVLGEETLVTNQLWYRTLNIDPKTNFNGYVFKSSSEPLSTIVGSGARTIELIYVKPTTTTKEVAPTKTYVVDETKDGTYRNEVAGRPTVVTTSVSYVYNPNTRTSEERVVETKQEGTPTVVTLGTKPTTEVTYRDFSTTYVADPTRTAGEKFTETAGVRGTTTVETTYSVNKETGEVTPTKGQPVVVAPRNAVVKVGTKPTVIEKPINFTTVYEGDETKRNGVRTDKVAGVQGKVITTTTYTLNESTGNVTANKPTERREEPTNKVVTVGTAPTVTTKRIAHGVEYQRDDTVSATSPSTRVQDGVDGEKRTTVTYSVNPTSGVVTGNAPVETTVASKPQIEKLATKPEDIVTTQDFKRTFVADETKDLGYRQVETVGVQGKTVVHRTYTLPDNVPSREETPGVAINYEFAVAIPHDSEPEVTAPVNEVTRVGVKPKVETQTIAVTTKYIADESLEFGKVVETEKGSEGRVVTTTTYTMNPTDGTTTANKPTVDTTPMVQRVVKVGVKKKVVETPIEFTTRYERDETAEAGKKTPSVSGVAGKTITTTTYTMNPTTGVVTENPSTTVREEPTTAVVKVGTKEKVEVTPIPSPVHYEGDTSVEKGSPNKETKGVDGSSTVTTTYSVDPKTGVVTETVGEPVVVKATETVVKVGAKSKVVVTPIPVEVDEVADSELFEGDEKVTSNGKAGSTTTTTEYVVNPKTGEITEKDPVVSTIPMEKKVVHKGTKKRKATVTISYVLKDNGSALGSPTVLENQQVGSPYNTSVKAFEPKVEVSELADRTVTKTTSYVLEKEPENKSGIVTETGVSVVYTYRALVREEVVMKASKLTVNFVLEGSREKLHESLVKEGVRVDDPYVTEPLALKDKVEKRLERNKEVITTTRYELVATPNNAQGTISVGGTVVDYFYRAAVTVEEYPTVPNETPKTELPEYTSPIGTPGISEVHDKPTYLGPVGTPGDSEVHELPKFKGGVVPNEAPKVEIPAYDNGVVPNDAPILEKPEYNEPLGFVPNDAPQFELPEFKGGVVPNDAPILEKPEYKIPTVSEEPKQPVTPLVETPQTPQLQAPQPKAPEKFVSKELPNTGTSKSDKLVAMSGVGLLGLLGLGFKKRKED